MIRRGDIVWVDFGSPRGSQPAKIRPALVIQENWLLDTDINTVLLVPLTSNTALATFPGNVLIPRDASGLPKDSVAVVAQIGPVSREYVDPYGVGALPGRLLDAVSDGIRLVTGI